MNVYLSYSDLFPEKKALSLELIKERFKSVNKDILYKVAIVLINRDVNEKAKDTIKSFLNNDLLSLKESLILCVNNLEEKRQKQHSILNIESSLFLFEIIHSVIQDTQIINLTDGKIELLLFKAYLCINEYLSKIIVENNKLYQNDLLKLLFTNNFAQNDFYNTIKANDFISQIYKAKLLLDYLEEYDNNILDRLITNFGLESKYSYIDHMVGLCGLVLKERKKTHIVLNIENKSLNKLMDRISISSDEKQSDIDFKLVRERPFYRNPVNINEYWVIYDLFLIDKIYSSLYFELKRIFIEINKGEEEKKLEDRFRTLFTTKFSEEKILYSVLNYIFGDKKFYKKSGKEIKECYNLKGEPDFYIRKNNTIYLFESKDILITGKIKRSYNYETILKRIKQAFVNDKKGIPQLLKNIERIINNKLPFDNFNNTNKLKIFPIIVTHNRQLDVSILNNILNTFFQKELLKYSYINNITIMPITLINIDVFIIFQDYLKDFKYFDFEVLLNEYHKQINKQVKVEDTIDVDDYAQRLLNNKEPFNRFISKKAKSKYKKLKLTKGIEKIVKGVFNH